MSRGVIFNLFGCRICEIAGEGKESSESEGSARIGREVYLVIYEFQNFNDPRLFHILNISEVWFELWRMKWRFLILFNGWDLISFERDWLRTDFNVIGFGLIGWLAPSSIPAINGKSLTGLFFESIGAELAHFPTPPALTSQFWLVKFTPLSSLFLTIVVVISFVIKLIQPWFMNIPEKSFCPKQTKRRKK